MGSNEHPYVYITRLLRLSQRVFLNRFAWGGGCLGVLLLFLCTISWTISPAWGHPPAQVHPSDLDIILLIDNSRSISANDPEGVRLRAARFLVDYLRMEAENRSTTFRIGIVTFSEPDKVSVLTSIRPVHDERITDQLVEQGELFQGTDFRPPLEFALDEFKITSENVPAKAVFLFTDGQPAPEGEEIGDDPEALEVYFTSENEGSLRDLIDKLRQQGVQVNILALGDAHENEKYWIDRVGETHYHPLSNVSDLSSLYHDMVNALLGAPAEPCTTVEITRTTTITFEVEPHLPRVVFSFFSSDPSQQIALQGPQGRTYAPMARGTDQEYHQIYPIERPAEGIWTATVSGVGTLRYCVDRSYPDIQVTLRPAAVQAGLPFTVTARLTYNQHPFTDTLGLDMEAILLNSNGQTTTIQLRPDPPAYIGQVAGIERAGPYTVTVQTRIGDSVVQSEPQQGEIVAVPAGPSPSPSPTSPATPSPTSTPLPFPPPGGLNTTVLLWVLGIFIFILLVAVAWLLWFLRQKQSEMSQMQEKPPKEDIEKWRNDTAEKAREHVKGGNVKEALKCWKDAFESAGSRWNPNVMESAMANDEGFWNTIKEHMGQLADKQIAYWAGVHDMLGEATEAVRGSLFDHSWELLLGEDIRLKDEDGQQVLKRINNAGVLELKSIAKYLKERWINRPDWFIDGLYLLIQEYHRPEQMLQELLDAEYPDGADEKRKEFFWRLVESHKNLLVRSREIVEEGEKWRPPEKRENIKKWKRTIGDLSLAFQSGKSLKISDNEKIDPVEFELYDHGARLFRFIQRLAENPFSKSSPFSIPDHALKYAPELWKKTIEICNSLVDIPYTEEKIDRSLQEAEKQAKSLKAWGHGLQVLVGIWREQFPRGEIAFGWSLAPDLALEGGEETECTLIIWNKGPGTALSVLVKIVQEQIEGNRYALTTKASQPEHPVFLKPGETFSVTFSFEEKNQNDKADASIPFNIGYYELVIVQAPHLSSPQRGEGLGGGGRARVGASETRAYPGIRNCSNTVNDYEEKFQGPESFSLPGSHPATNEEATSLSNPFILDDPVYGDEGFMMDESRKEIIEGIKEEIVEAGKERMQRSYYFWGARKMGKTTLLLHLERDLMKNQNAEEDGYILVTVYVPCTFLIDEPDLSPEKFLGFLAREIWRKIRRHKGIKSPLYREEFPSNLTQAEFWKFLTTLECKLPPNTPPLFVFMFDDADAILEVEADNEGQKSVGKTILKYLGSLKAAMNFFTILTGEHHNPDFSNDSNPEPRRLLLFTRSTTEELAQKSQTLKYTDQALAYLWRTSGGYPSLVQLICYQVFEDWKKPGTQGQNQEKTITLARVRSALSNLLANTDVDKFFRYIYRYSFTEEEREILSKVVQSADRTTLKIDPEGVEKHLLAALETKQVAALKTKQVIERRAENGDDWYLRIGFFKLWIERQREANDNIQEKEL